LSITSRFRFNRPRVEWQPRFPPRVSRSPLSRSKTSVTQPLLRMEVSKFETSRVKWWPHLPPPVQRSVSQPLLLLLRAGLQRPGQSLSHQLRDRPHPLLIVRNGERRRRKSASYRMVKDVARQRWSYPSRRSAAARMR